MATTDMTTMTPSTLQCPECGCAIEVTQLLRDSVGREVRDELREHQAQHARDLQAARDERDAAAARADALRLQAQELEQRAARERAERELEAARQADARVAAETKRVQAEADAQRERQVADAVRLHEEELKAARERLVAAEAQAAAARRREREVEERELEKREPKADLVVEERVAAETQQIRAAAQAEAEARRERQVAEAARLHEEQLAEARQRLAAAAAQQAELLARQRELEARDGERAVELQRRLLEESQKIHADAAAKAAEALRLEEAEHKLQLEGMQRQIEELRRKASQGSVQLQGEAQEVVLQERLERAFPRDAFSEVAKGVRGADVQHLVHDERGAVCGSILWESKRTKAWQAGWLSKLRDDQAACEADVAVIVTQTLPPNVDRVARIDGVWVCSPADAVPLALVLRGMLERLAEEQVTAEDRDTKADALYAYVTSQAFARHVAKQVELHADLVEQLDRERKAMTAGWRRRERALEQLVASLGRFYGDVQGFTGGEAPKVAGLELDEPAAADDAAADADDDAADAGVARPARLVDVLFGVVPADGSPIGNKTGCEKFVDAALQQHGAVVGEADYARCKAELLSQGRIKSGRGRGGSIARAS